MPSFSIRLASNSDQSAWDSYVQSRPASAPYHLFAWKLAVEEAYRHKGYYLIAEEQGETRGVLPLIHMRLPLLQNQLVSLPFCDLAGPLADSSNIKEALLKEAIRLGQKLGCKKIEIRSRCNTENSGPSVKSSVNTNAVQNLSTANCQLPTGLINKVSMLLDLPGSSEELWDSFKSKLRSQVRKAKKNGLVCKWGELEDIDTFYEIFSKNMHELGSPVHAKKFISAILKNYQFYCRSGLIYKDNLPIGCGIIIFCGNTVSIPWASTLRKFNRLSPNMLLYWNFLQFAADNGYTLFDFGRSTPGEGTYKFKAQWGARPVPLNWQSLNADSLEILKKEKELNQSAPINAKSALNTRDRIEKVWQKLPLALANLLGPLVRKWVSL